MRRSLALALLFLVPQIATAEDSVTLWTNYYKERSTRVIEPIATVTKDLPADARAQVTYLVDQITSASGTFTVVDKPFTEYRQEAKVHLQKRFEHTLTPGVMFRVSHEPDYTSITFGGDLEYSAFDDNTVLRLYAQRQLDTVLKRDQTDPEGHLDPSFRQPLGTSLLGLSWTQTLAKDLIAGLSLEAQVLRGYIQNPYVPNQTHPRKRDRYSASAFVAYQLPWTGTTGRASYRFYSDDWSLVGHTFQIELSQPVVPGLEVTARIREYTQSGVSFAPDSGYTNAEPKLRPFDSQLYGAEIRWTLAFLKDTALDPFRRSELVPSYAYLDQHNFYGPAHMIQLGWYWPY